MKYDKIAHPIPNDLEKENKRNVRCERISSYNVANIQFTDQG